MSKGERRTLVGWMVANPIFLLTIATAGFYAAVRYGQQKFYGRLGLTPEDVGLDRFDTLARSTGLAFAVLLFLTVVVAGPVMVYGLIKYHETRVPFPAPRLFRAFFAAAAFAAAVLVVVAYVGTFSRQATSAVATVKAGRPVRLKFLIDTGIHAERARIAWIGDAPSGLRGLSTHTLMYIGQSGGAVVLYDVDGKRSIRIPSSKVAVAILP
jgi:phosphoglycerol transferase MdoB-like AlkP superfamily enzyme